MMSSASRRCLFILIFQALLILGATKNLCEEKLRNCTEVMQPVLNEVRYMFPTTEIDVEGMCKIWSYIMDCIRKYMTECSTEEQKMKFNEAVSNSVDSVHAVCSSERYRKDYLENALCFKRVSMDNCGFHFKNMIDSAYNPLSKELHICCAYIQYEKCVSEPIQKMCGPQTLHLLDHSMASLKSRCDLVTQSLKASGGSCPLPDSAPASSTSHKKPPQSSSRSLSQNFHIYSTADNLLSSPLTYTTPVWTPRTVIYPLPVTRHSSRVLRSGECNVVAKTKTLAITGLLILIILL